MVERDLFGSILFLALQQKIGMSETLWNQFLFVWLALMDQYKRLQKVDCLKK